MTELVVLVPTRSRPHLVPRMVDAWFKTGAFGVAELHFVIDQDDMSFDQYRRMFDRYPSVNYGIRPEWQPMVPKLNYGAVLAAEHATNVAFMGDDHVPRTEMWAHKLIAAHLAHGPSIAYGRDGFQDKALPTWWSMSSSIIGKLGRMVPAPVQHLYCDNAVKMLGEEIERLVYLEDVLIEHMHPIAGKAKMDDQYVRVNRKQQYARDEAAFRGWMADGLDRDARLLASIWG